MKNKQNISSKCFNSISFRLGYLTNITNYKVRFVIELINSNIIVEPTPNCLILCKSLKLIPRTRDKLKLFKVKQTFRSGLIVYNKTYNWARSKKQVKSARFFDDPSIFKFQETKKGVILNIPNSKIKPIDTIIQLEMYIHKL